METAALLFVLAVSLFMIWTVHTKPELTRGSIERAAFISLGFLAAIVSAAILAGIV